MPLTIPKYRLALDDLANETEVDVLPGDQLRAEVEGQRRGLTDHKAQPFLLTTLWLWASCRRLGLIDKAEKFEPFVDRLVAWESVKSATGEPEAGEVDPTPEAGRSTSASPSLPASPGSTGSEPSTTTPPSSHRLSD